MQLTFLKTADRIRSELVYRANLALYSRKRPHLEPSDRLIVDTLRKEGVFVTNLDALAIPSTPLMMEAVKGLLPTLPDTLPNKKLGKMSAIQHAVNVSTQKVAANFPELFLWGLDEKLINIVEHYIGLPVAYLGASIRRDLDNKNQIGTRLWHRDAEDRRTVKVIVYLNDVDEDGGPFEYISRAFSPSYRLFKSVHCTITDSDMQRVVSSSKWQPCCGPAGTVVIVDTTSVFHHGKVPKQERFAVFLTYISRQPKRPEICKSRFSKAELLLLASMQLSQRQRECVLWEPEMMNAFKQSSRLSSTSKPLVKQESGHPVKSQFEPDLDL